MEQKMGVEIRVIQTQLRQIINCKSPLFQRKPTEMAKNSPSHLICNSIR